MSNDLTWEQLLEVKDGTILVDRFEDGVRVLILKGTSLCCYLGIPIDHPLAGFDYDDIALSCHGGLTFCGAGDGEYRPSGYYYYGWDYAHLGDYSFYYDTTPGLKLTDRSNDKKWLVKDVEEDLWSPLYDFKKLMRLAENIVSKKYKIAVSE